MKKQFYNMLKKVHDILDNLGVYFEIISLERISFFKENACKENEYVINMNFRRSESFDDEASECDNNSIKYTNKVNGEEYNDREMSVYESEKLFFSLFEILNSLEKLSEKSNNLENLIEFKEYRKYVFLNTIDYFQILLQENKLNKTLIKYATEYSRDNKVNKKFVKMVNEVKPYFKGLSKIYIRNLEYETTKKELSEIEELILNIIDFSIISEETFLLALSLPYITSAMYPNLKENINYYKSLSKRYNRYVKQYIEYLKNCKSKR